MSKKKLQEIFKLAVILRSADSWDDSRMCNSVYFDEAKEFLEAWENWKQRHGKKKA